MSAMTSRVDPNPIWSRLSLGCRPSAAIYWSCIAVLWLAATASAFAPAVVRAESPGYDSTSTRSPIEGLTSEREIERLIHDYAWLLDARDFAAFGRLFSDGVWLAPDGSVVARGAEEVEALVRRFLGAKTDTFVRHLVTNIRIDLDPSGQAGSATSFLTTLEGKLGGSGIVYRIARYHDRFQRIDGRWRFESRQEFTDWVLEERSALGAP